MNVWDQFITKWWIKWVWYQQTLACCTWCSVFPNSNPWLQRGAFVEQHFHTGQASPRAPITCEESQYRNSRLSLCPLHVELSDGSSNACRFLIFFNLSPYISTSFIRKKREKSILCWNRLPPALLPNVSKSQWKGLSPDFSAGPVNHSQKYHFNLTSDVHQQEWNIF